MLYRKMPRNGDELSILGFGCMRLPMKDGKIDEPERDRPDSLRHRSGRQLRRYGVAIPCRRERNGARQGPARRLPEPRQAGHQATLVDDQEPRGHGPLPGGPDGRNSGRGHIDYYLVHALNGKLWDNVERLGVRDFLDQAKKDGRIGNAGFSFHGLADDFGRIVDAYPWAFCQIQYNYLDENNQAGTAGLEYAAARGLGVVVMEPLRGGNLALPASAARHRGDLERGQGAPHAGRVGAPLGLEPARSHRGPLRHEPGGADPGKPRHRRRGPCPTP